MQEKKNKWLLLLLVVLVIVTVAVFFSDSSNDRIDVDRALFSFEDPAAIDHVVFKLPGEEVTLDYDNQWTVNKKYKADPQRIKVLFAVLKQVQVRRPVSRQKADSILRQVEETGTLVRFYKEGQIVHEFKVLGNKHSGLTYMQNTADNKVYIVEIPGYRSYLAGIFTVDGNGWRDPLVFDLNWGNLQSVSFTYPGNTDNNFDVVFDDRLYKVKQLQQTDTTRLFDLLDNVSRLYVNDYLSKNEVKQHKRPLAATTATIVVTDVGQNNYSLEVFGEFDEGNAFIVRIDSVDYALLDRNKLRQILKPRSFLSQGKK